MPSGHARAAELDEMECIAGGSQTICRIGYDGNGLELRVVPDLALKARRLGRWRVSSQDGITTISCNARIDLGDDVVYGVLQSNSANGTSLIWPQLRIDIPDLHMKQN